MNFNGVKNFRHHRRLPSSDRFLDIYSTSPKTNVADDLTESDVLYSDSPESTRESSPSQLARRKLAFRAAEDASRPRAIPKPGRVGAELTRRFGNSAPVNVPPAMRKGRRFSEFDDFYEDENEEEEMLPPHEIVAMKVKATSSVLEGVGRTLKGRDLRQVRDAVWRQSGFID